MTTDQTHLGRQPENGTASAGPAPADPERTRGGRAQTLRGSDRRRATAPSAAAHDGSGAVRGAVLLVVVTVLVALGGGWAVTTATSPTYRTQAKVLVLPSSDGQSATAATSAAAVADQVPTWAALAQTPAVLDPAVKASGLRLASTQAVEAVSASPEASTSIITIEAEGASARAAAQLASATAASLVEQIATRSTFGGAAQVAGSVVQEPEVPVAPASPDLLLNLAVAAAVGLAVALAILVAARALALRRQEGSRDQRHDADESAAGAAPGESAPTHR